MSKWVHLVKLKFDVASWTMFGIMHLAVTESEIVSQSTIQPNSLMAIKKIDVPTFQPTGFGIRYSLDREYRILHVEPISHQ